MCITTRAPRAPLTSSSISSGHSGGARFRFRRQAGLLPLAVLPSLLPVSPALLLGLVSDASFRFRFPRCPPFLFIRSARGSVLGGVRLKDDTGLSNVAQEQALFPFSCGYWTFSASLCVSGQIRTAFSRVSSEYLRLANQNLPFDDPCSRCPTLRTTLPWIPVLRPRPLTLFQTVRIRTPRTLISRIRT